MKVYNVVVNVMEDGNSSYSEVRSFKSFESALKCLRSEYDYVLTHFAYDECDIKDFDEDIDNEIAWFDLEIYQWNIYGGGSIFVCEIED